MERRARQRGAAERGVSFIYTLLFLPVSPFVLGPFFLVVEGSVLADLVEFNHGKIPSSVARDN